MPRRLDQYKWLGDFHTHSIYSLHAMSSPQEIVDFARMKGLKYVAITDHFYPTMYNEKNQSPPIGWGEVIALNQVSRVKYDMGHAFKGYQEIKVIPGFEYSIIPCIHDDDCDVSEANQYYLNCQLLGYQFKSISEINGMGILSLHSWYLRGVHPTAKNILMDVQNQLGGMNFLGHIDQWVGQIEELKDVKKRHEFLCTIVDMCCDKGLPIELNENSCHKKDVCAFSLELMEICQEMKALVVVNSDTHIASRVGQMEYGISMLDSIGYPADWIVNLDKDKIERLLMNKEN